MFKLKIGTLIYDHEEREWGLIAQIDEDRCFLTIWSDSMDQFLDELDLELDRFEIHEV